MTEKFDRFKKGDNEENEEYTTYEYEEAFFNDLIDIMMKTYQHLQEIASEIAQEIENDYKEFINGLTEYFYKNKTTFGSLDYILSKNPNNLWVEVIKYLALSGLEELIKNPQKEAAAYRGILEQLEQSIKKKRKGKHLQ